MNEDLTQVVNAVADRLGIAVEKLQPVAETMVNEVAKAHLMEAATLTIVALVFAALLLGANASLLRILTLGNECDYAFNAFSCTLLCRLVMALVCPILLAEAGFALSRAMSPTYHLLKGLM